MTITEERPAPPMLDGPAILNEARSFIGRFVAMPSPAALDLAAMWALHTHCVDKEGKLLLDETPRLVYLSDAENSGKSRALETMGALCRKPAEIADVTGPAMHTLIANGHCLLIDELDLIFGAGDSAKPIRAAINAGYRRKGAVARNKGMSSVFAPVAAAGLAVTFTRNPLLKPTKSRAIAVIMQPNRGRVQLERWRDRIHDAEAGQIRNAMAAWAQANIVRITTTYPDLPEGCDDRLADLWEPLLILAAVLGGDATERMLAAYEEYGASSGGTDTSLPPGQQLMADIREIWPEGASRMATADLVEALMSADGAVWPSIWRDAAQIPHELASLLAPYGIAPRKLRPEAGSAPVQGYLRGDFEADAPEA
jgi:hypothetical protein